MNPDPFNELSWNDDPLHSPNRTEYIEKLRARVKELEGACVMKNTTLDNLAGWFFNAASDGFKKAGVGDSDSAIAMINEARRPCLDLSLEYRNQLAKLTALEKERDKLQGELLASSLLLSQRTAERDQLKGVVADARWLLENIWMDMKGHNSVDVFRRRDAWLAKNPTPHDATGRQKE